MISTQMKLNSEKKLFLERKRNLNKARKAVEYAMGTATALGTMELRHALENIRLALVSAKAVYDRRVEIIKSEATNVTSSNEIKNS